MIQKYRTCLFCLLLFTACTTHTTNTVDTSRDTVNQKSTSTQQTDVTRIKDSALNYKIDTSKQVNTLLLPRDTLVTVDLQDHKGSVRAYLSGIGKHVTVIVPVAGGDSITATIFPDGDSANIRFNQIYIPAGKKGTYDGPFSKKITYPVTAKGDYRLIIGEDLTAEGDWHGSFTCNVTISSKH